MLVFSAVQASPVFTSIGCWTTHGMKSDVRFEKGFISCQQILDCRKRYGRIVFNEQFEAKYQISKKLFGIRIPRSCIRTQLENRKLCHLELSVDRSGQHLHLASVSLKRV